MVATKAQTAEVPRRPSNSIHIAQLAISAFYPRLVCVRIAATITSRQLPQVALAKLWST